MRFLLILLENRNSKNIVFFQKNVSCQTLYQLFFYLAIYQIMAYLLNNRVINKLLHRI